MFSSRLRRILLRVHNLPENLSLIIPPLVTMFISGLWHGTGLTFITWGLYYGVLIVVYQLMGFHGNWKPAGALKHLAAWLVMFSLIVFGWIIFRAQSVPWLWGILLHSPLYHDSGELVTSLVLTGMIAFYAALLAIKHVLDTYCPKWANLHALYYVVATLLIIIYINSSSPDFIYFQF